MSKDRSTICWDCARATSTDCPWADHGEPVDGWWARHRRISSGWRPFDTFCVLRCPNFVRDAIRAGQSPYKPLKGERENESSNCDKCSSSAPVRGVVEPLGSRPVDNGRGALAGEASRGQGVLNQPYRDTLDLAYLIIERAVEDWKALDYGKRSEAIVDKDFEVLADTTSYTPKQIRHALHIPEDALEILACANEGRR